MCRKQKLKVVLFMIPVILSFSGCSAAELENRCFPMSAVVDYRDNGVEFAYGFPELSQQEETDITEAKVNARMTRQADFESCVEAYEKELNKTPDCNHLKVLVLGSDFLGTKDKYYEMLDYLRKTERFPRNTYVCVTDHAGKLFEVVKNLPEDIGTYLELFLQNRESEAQMKLMNLGKLMDEKENHSERLKLPYLVIEGDSIIWDTYYELD